MIEGTHLFLGGHFDGQRRPAPYDIINLGGDIYQSVGLSCKSINHKVFLHRDLVGDADVLDMLISGYVSSDCDEE